MILLIKCDISILTEIQTVKQTKETENLKMPTDYFQNPQ